MKNPLEWLRRAYPSPQPVTWETVFGSSEVLAGVTVTEYSSLSYSPVWAGVSTLSRDIAKLPLVFYKNLPNGGKERFHKHPLYRVLHDEPNPEMTSFKFRETMQALCILYGNAYAEIVRDGLDRVAGLYPIAPSRVTPFRGEAGRLQYKVTNHNGGHTVLPPARIIHLSSLSTDGVIGHSLVEHAGESIGLSVAAEKFGSAFFGNGSTFGGVIDVPGELKEPAKDNLRKLVESVHRGVDRAHKILVLANGAKFTPRGTAPNEAQFTETRKFQINEVARWLGMPPHKLGDLENAHFTNIEEQELQYYVGCVSGWLKMWEQELTRKLVSPLEYSQQTIEHVLEGVLRGDSSKRADYYGKMYSIGAFSINDILRLENMNPIGAAGDMHLMPLNMVPAEKYAEYFEKKMLAETAQPVKELPPPTNEAAEEAARTLQTAIEERDAALAAVKEQESRVEEARAASAATAAALSEARTAVDHHTERADVAGTGRDVAILEAEAARAAVVARDAELQTLQQALDAADVERQRVEQRATSATEAAADAALALASAAREAEAARVELAAAEARAQEDAERIVAAKAEVEARSAALLQVSEAAAAEAESARAQVAQVETTLQVRKVAELDRLVRVVAAHRGLIAHAVQRLLRPEVDRARRRQGTPESLRKWVEAFYVTHRDVCAEELYPAVFTHLAWKRSDEDPRAVARSLAEAHCEQSERDLRAVLDGTDDGDDFHAGLERVLSRWERDRPNTMADTMLSDEITYIRSMS